MQKVIVLDGGMGQALVKRSKRELTAMWSADIMLHEPNLVRDLHCEFIASGAHIITLNTYTATPQRLIRDASLSLLEPLHKAAIKAAKEAIALTPKSNTQIAGCLPPLVASYHPDDSMLFEEAFDTYQQLVGLQNSAADIFICETMSSVNEAKAACMAAKESGKPVWVAFSVSDKAPKKLRGGELLRDALSAIKTLNPDKILINCSRPESISNALPTLSEFCKAHHIEFGMYANGFKAVDALYPGDTVAHLRDRKDLTPEKYAEYGLDWVRAGASVIGGCCEISPKHIMALAKALNNQ